MIQNYPPISVSTETRPCIDQLAVLLEKVPESKREMVAMHLMGMVQGVLLDAALHSEVA